MAPAPPRVDAAYREYADVLLRHHDLLSAATPDETEIDRVEEALETLWDALDGEQQRSLRGMSSDLNWIRRRGDPPPKGRPVEAVTPAEVDALNAAQAAGEWHTVLHHLRVCAPNLPRDLAAFGRGTCYFKLGFREAAAAALDLGVELARGDSYTGRGAFDALLLLSPLRAFHRAVAVMGQPAAHPPAIVALAVRSILDMLHGSVDVGRVVSDIKEARDRLVGMGEPPGEALRFYQVAAGVMRAVGESAGAGELYDAGLRLAPDDPVLLAGRGDVLYAADPDRASLLFHRTMTIEPDLLRPHLYLSHYHLTRGRFRIAYGYAYQALELAAPGVGRAAAAELMAVSASEDGQPDELIRRLFADAIENAKGTVMEARVVSNYEAYQEMGRSTEKRGVYRTDDLAFDQVNSTESMSENALVNRLLVTFSHLDRQPVTNGSRH